MTYAAPWRRDDAIAVALAAPTGAEGLLTANNQRAEDYTPRFCPLIRPFEAPNGTWFDEAIDFRDPEGHTLALRVLALIDEIEGRKRKWRATDRANRYLLVRRILANGFRCLYHRQPSLVAYLRKADGYPNKPAWLSGKAMARTADLLAAAGLLKLSSGERGTASTYDVTLMLNRVGHECGITDASLTVCLSPEGLVRLRGAPPARDMIAFEPTSETLDWTARLAAYNRFLTQQTVALNLSREEESQWVAELNQSFGERAIPIYRPELIQTDLYRVFNNGSFDQGGRMYGGWWINAPKELRPKITINGQPTVELDYSGCAIRMLYHEAGIDYRDDPYRLEAIAAHEEQQDLEPGHYREAIKALVQALINDREGSHPELIPLPNGLSFRPFYKRRELMQMIEEKHAPIADMFGTGAGLRLQRYDSDLALAIITALRERGVVALPVHDSFITTIEEERVLRQAMEGIYKDMFKFEPVIG